MMQLKNTSTMNKNTLQTLSISMPTIGIVIFFGMYFYATSLYPGGSQVDSNSIGFDWINNYWCDLLKENTQNGRPNPANPVSKIAMVILPISLIFFFYYFPKFVDTTKTWATIIRVTGLTSMISSVFIFTSFHDIVIMTSGFFALIALVGIFIGLIKIRYHFQFYFGIFCLILMGINNYLYFITQSYDYLPLIQKVTFAIVLIWIITVNKLFYTNT